jgi:hypothetical protein
MKNKKSFISILTISVFALFTELNASSSINDIGHIPLNPEPIESLGHRAPTTVPIQCYYSNGELTFTFSADLGTVECEVVRLSDETVYEATFYATNGGYDSLYVSTAPDDYEITLTCADGTIYYGEYSIE